MNVLQQIPMIGIEETVVLFSQQFEIRSIARFEGRNRISVLLRLPATSKTLQHITIDKATLLNFTK